MDTAEIRRRFVAHFEQNTTVGAHTPVPSASLLLDDPVQHIDDFRALHLVEVLAALRLDGRQIICAVEDASLADLLCRRLVSTANEGGRRLDIGVGPLGTTSVVTDQEIYPMPVGVLRNVAIA